MVAAIISSGLFGTPPTTRTRILLSDARDGRSCLRTRDVITRVDLLYRHLGFNLQAITSFNQSFFHPSVRGLRVSGEAYLRVGCSEMPAVDLTGSPDPSSIVCDCFSPGARLEAGWGIEDADVELFIRMQELLPSRGARIFVIGNAFGYSALVLGLLFATPTSAGSVDIIDAELEGDCNIAGSWLTRKLVNVADLNVNLFRGKSPEDVLSAARSPRYNLAFIDGEHSGSQLVKDFEAVVPLLREAAFVVLHDVGWWGLHGAVEKLPPDWHRHTVRGLAYKNLLGTVLLSRGVDPALYRGL